jgi:hypothetical protein
VAKNLIAEIIGGAQRVIDVKSKRLSQSKKDQRREELARVWNPRMADKATRVALLRIFAKFTASMTIFNVFGAVTPALVGQGKLVDRLDCALQTCSPRAVSLRLLCSQESGLFRSPH